MSEGFAFWKMAGGGNDFIVLDGMTRPLPELDGAVIARLCRRGVSVGADGLVALVASTQADAGMLHWNADGGPNAFCGNGTRCAARFAVEAGLVADRSLTVETGAGVLRCEVLEDGTVRTEVPRPKDLRRGLRLELPAGAGLPRTVEGDFVIVGVPHLVVEAGDPESLDVQRLGAALRRHELLGPAGANVHFVRPVEDGALEIRSYERGVEGETLACGSGAVAAALCRRLRTGGDGPVVLRTRSGIRLTVRLDGDLSAGPTAWLEGDARVIYRAELSGEAARGFPA